MRERVERRDRIHTECLDELARRLVAEAFYVHCIARGVVRQSQRDLRAAGEGVGAKQMRAVFFNMRTAGRAAGGFHDLLRGSVVRHRAEDFGDHVVAAADEHARADLDAFALDVVVIIQRRALNRRARELHRAEVRQRCELARAPDLPRDVFDNRGRLLSGEFICHRPARKLLRLAQCFSQRKIGDLDDHAVDQKIQRAACLLRTIDLAFKVFGGVAIADIRADREAVFG